MPMNNKMILPKAPPLPSTRTREPTLEEAGIFAGSGFIMTDEERAEAAAASEAHRSYWDRAIATALDRRCACCGTGKVPMGAPQLLCRPCGVAIAQIRSERAAAEMVDGLSRRQLAENWLDQ